MDPGVPWVRDGNPPRTRHSSTRSRRRASISTSKSSIWSRATPYMEALTRPPAIAAARDPAAQLSRGVLRRPQARRLLRRSRRGLGRPAVIGTPLRRPVLVRAGRVTSRGRMSLVADIPDGATNDPRRPRDPRARWPLLPVDRGRVDVRVGRNHVTGPDGGQPVKELRGATRRDGTGRTLVRPTRAPTLAARRSPLRSRRHLPPLQDHDGRRPVRARSARPTSTGAASSTTAKSPPSRFPTRCATPRTTRPATCGRGCGASSSASRRSSELALLRDPIAGFELFKRSATPATGSCR